MTTHLLFGDCDLSIAVFTLDPSLWTLVCHVILKLAALYHDTTLRTLHRPEFTLCQMCLLNKIDSNTEVIFMYYCYVNNVQVS